MNRKRKQKRIEQELRERNLEQSKARPTVDKGLGMITQQANR